ncbi:MAG: DUF1549 and DUF1553 domain-containing protein, partial [Pirellulales bacterium]|nr:DUF1549 and DUF1553 domain-containing protein [Pirellulales bacterium]
PEATEEQKLATGFCRNHMINGEGGRIAEENRVEYVMDMSETMGTVWLGLTLNCCRCHDHKYDPITNQEYYRLFAYFNQTPVSGAGGDPQTPPLLAIANDQQQRELEDLGQQIAKLDDAVEKRKGILSGQQDRWEQQKRQQVASAPSWSMLVPDEVAALDATLEVLPDHSVLAGGKNPDNDTYSLRASTSLKRVTGLRIEALRHESMTKHGLARSDSGNFVLTGLEVAVSAPGKPPQRPIQIVSAQASFEQGSYVVGNVLDDNPKSGWAVYQGRPIDRDHVAIFRFEQAVELGPQDVLHFVLRHDSVHKKHNLGRFRLSLTESEEPSFNDESEALRIALRLPPDGRSDDQKKLLIDAHRRSDETFRSLSEQRQKLSQRKNEIEKKLPQVMVMADRDQPRKTHVLQRGLYNKPQEEVAEGLPAFLPASQQPHSRGRLRLARWLVSEENPLTARVTVNRFWQQLFGVGLVKTTEDFGTQGEIPPHMDLLNWLAVEFRQSGWNVKELMRLMVTSHTYRQSSKIRSREEYERDPQNRLLARGARYRMPSWMLRDQALAVSGLLSPVVGGPAVNSYQPAGVWEEASFGKKKYVQDSGEKLYRRSLYTFWRRIIRPTMFFDSASRQTCTVKVSRTNTPLHALQTLNDVAYVEAARVLAQHALRSHSDSDQQRLEFIFRRVLARAPEEAESAIFLQGLQRTGVQFQASPEDAQKLISIGQSSSDTALDPIEHASWTALSLAVLNLDETLTRE